ncbi:MAG: D-aminoacyl-tRNA deacylase [Christensenellales bacterium]
MRAVIQRVSHAKVTVDNQEISSIGCGLLVFLGVEQGDNDLDLQYVCRKIAGLRVFEDENGKMNLSLDAVKGSLLIVSQFTLMADLKHGSRPSFSAAGDPDIGRAYYEKAILLFQGMGIPTKAGVFGADMAVELCNDGPVTLLLSSRKDF